MDKKEPLKLMPLDEFGKLVGRVAEKTEKQPTEQPEKSGTEQPKRKRQPNED